MTGKTGGFRFFKTNDRAVDIDIDQGFGNF
jgi:hypothetical protein